MTRHMFEMFEGRIRTGRYGPPYLRKDPQGEIREVGFPVHQDGLLRIQVVTDPTGTIRSAQVRQVHLHKGPMRDLAHGDPRMGDLGRIFHDERPVCPIPGCRKRLYHPLTPDPWHVEYRCHHGAVVDHEREAEYDPQYQQWFWNEWDGNILDDATPQTRTSLQEVVDLLGRYVEYCEGRSRRRWVMPFNEPMVLVRGLGRAPMVPSLRKLAKSFSNDWEVVVDFGTSSMRAHRVLSDQQWGWPVYAEGRPAMDDEGRDTGGTELLLYLLIWDTCLQAGLDQSYEEVQRRIDQLISSLPTLAAPHARQDVQQLLNAADQTLRAASREAYRHWSERGNALHVLGLFCPMPPSDLEKVQTMAITAINRAKS